MVDRAQRRHATRDRGHGETDAERHNEIQVEREQIYQVAGRELHLHHLVHVCEVVVQQNVGDSFDVGAGGDEVGQIRDHAGAERGRRVRHRLGGPRQGCGPRLRRRAGPMAQLRATFHRRVSL